MQFTPCEIRRHNSAASAWIVVKQSVYDITEFISTHPGGIKSLLRYSGGVKDCSDDMAFHSASAQKLMQSYKIGRLVGCGGTGDREEVKGIYEAEEEKCTIM
ncbi:hypothetical protein TL16_g07155 [Triparma laevis f. inornata]|uniref:Cytochrome b5 heme-binding domain-containing protein n=1 Tax=Triparma laevis f. inornata TaxID=1714386 RepID=A0A9W7EH88_9STRA|nr:hypothetical protein TL16_g07155 [Triparma laevis f. inornata]